jgi:hypothetical protein
VWTGHRQEFSVQLEYHGSRFVTKVLTRDEERGREFIEEGIPKKITVHLSGWLSIICNHI